MGKAKRSFAAKVSFDSFLFKEKNDYLSSRSTLAPV